MHSVWFGEFLGTLVLLVLGNGVNAGVTLRKSYAADSGWMVIATGWGLGVLCGVLVAQAFGSSGANLNPAVTLAVAIDGGDYSTLLSCVDHRRRSHRIKGRIGHRSGASARSVACRQPGVGHRPLARRYNRIRHQSRTRPGATACPFHVAHTRQGRIELGLRTDSDHWTAGGGSVGWAAHASSAFVKMRNRHKPIGTRFYASLAVMRSQGIAFIPGRKQSPPAKQ